MITNHNLIYSHKILLKDCKFNFFSIYSNVSKILPTVNNSYQNNITNLSLV